MKDLKDLRLKGEGWTVYVQDNFAFLKGDCKDKMVSKPSNEYLLEVIDGDNFTIDKISAYFGNNRGVDFKIDRKGIGFDEGQLYSYENNNGSVNSIGRKSEKHRLIINGVVSIETVAKRIKKFFNER